MEILAHTDGYDKHYIVRISEAELEKLTGHYYKRHEFKIGEKLDVSGLYEQLEKIKSLRGEMNQCLARVDNMKKALVDIDPIISAFEEKKGE